MLRANYTAQFRKDYSLMQKRSIDILLLVDVMKKLENKNPLLQKHKDHLLIGNYRGCRECHIKPDWLLIYQLSTDVIIFTRTGTHADLF